MMSFLQGLFQALRFYFIHVEPEAIEIVSLIIEDTEGIQTGNIVGEHIPLRLRTRRSFIKRRPFGNRGVI